jgi:two-component system LytT family response regulator
LFVIRAYVVDDERLAVQRLTRLLEETRRVDVAGSAIDPVEALAFLRGNRVDVLFLDIQMPGLTGFELLEQLEQPPVVIFTTAYDAYALEAFETAAIDYLLKPIEPARLARAIDKAERLAGQPQPDIRALAREVAAALGDTALGDGSPYSTRRPVPQDTRPVPLQRIASRVGERTTLLDVARITHFVARDKLTFAVTGGREHIVDATLAELESRLDGRRFIRIHRSTIVNASFVGELHPSVDGGLLVRLKDEGRSELSVARDRVRELKQRLGI